jgi:hypothetical protein
MVRHRCSAGWVYEKSIGPQVPVWCNSRRKDNTFSVGDFIWHPESDAYQCPAWKSLSSRHPHVKERPTKVTKANTIIYRTHLSACSVCPLKPRCCPSVAARKIARSIYQDACNAARGIATIKEYRQSRCECKKVEMLFAAAVP